jgi:hypothetical protein
MSEQNMGGNSDGPSKKTLAKGAFWTFIGALVVTVLFVLPAEYGVDPTGVGGMLGLTRLAAPAAPDIDAAPRIVEGSFPQFSPDDEFDYFEPETLGAPFSRSQDESFQSKSMIVELAEFEQVEVKAVMQQGDSLVYSWRLVEGESVYSDFHADPLQADQFPEQFWIRYHESEDPAASGAIVAPFDGNHGWYWLNIEENPVKIELTVHGYWDSLDEIMRSFQ